MSEPHLALLRPVGRIKGQPGLVPVWREVGGINSCGSTNDGYLSYAQPGDYVVVFAQPLRQLSRAAGKMVDTNDFSLFGLRPEEAVDSRIVDALRTFDVPLEPGAAH
jgi:hypothetical protein